MLNNALQTPIFIKLVRLKFECVDSKTGYNIVEFTAISGKTEIMKILLEHRTDLMDYLDIGKSLKYAIAQDDVEMVKCMLDFSKNERIGYGSKGYGSLNDLCFAIEINKIKIVEVFLEYSKPETDGAIFHFTDVHYVDYYGQVSHKDDESDNEFYKFFDINGIKNEIPINALLLASKLGRTEIAILLLTKGASPNTAGGLNKISALQLAALYSHLDTVKVLIDFGAKVLQEDLEDLNWAWSNTKTEIDLRIVNLLTDELNKATINTEEIQKSNNFASTTIDEESNKSKNDEISLSESENELPVSKHDSSSKYISGSSDFEPTSTEKMSENSKNDEISLNESRNGFPTFMHTKHISESHNYVEHTEAKIKDTTETASERNSDGESQNSEDPMEMVKPLVTTLLNKHFPSEGKISCLSAIFVLITKDFKVCEFLAKKEIGDEITALAEKVVNQPHNLSIIAKVLSKLNEFKHGKELIDEIRMPIGVYEKLRAQMKRVEVLKNPNNFAFTSDENPSKKIKIENVKIEPE